MKIKIDYVTNSSSCCFLISSPREITKTELHDLGVQPSMFNNFGCISTIEKLIEHVDCEPCDWVKKATGPRRFWGATEEWYNRSKKIIEEGNFVVHVDIERNFDDVDCFENAIKTMNLEVLTKDYD